MFHNDYNDSSLAVAMKKPVFGARCCNVVLIKYCSLFMPSGAAPMRMADNNVFIEIGSDLLIVTVHCPKEPRQATFSPGP